MKKKIITIIISAAVIGSIIGLSVMTKNKNQYIPVKIAAATKGDIQEYLSTTALIESQDVKQYYASQAKIDKVNVKVGDAVKEGDVLVTYDSQDLNTSPKQTISNIVADRAGVVTSVNAVEGSIGNQQQAALVTENLENLKAVLSVSKYDANKIKLNQNAIISSNGNEYHGIVSYIAPIAQSSQNLNSGDATLEVDVTITDKSPQLKIGFDTDINILLNEVKNVLKVPVESIKTDKTGKSVVYIVKNNKAVESAVKVGIQSDTEAQITDGVELGEKVILNPTDEIQNGTLVK
ncbi:efflux RND transporter periplasmic adaptor subunit [Clostridium sp. WILCCON 0269]|uniref:Efflux RND transporter periplasmic adaptor subunit n=1 Tax=Candidatus Clostridium eludens TaxID=3381663 RepID=A0ABW8SI81_9CLOT